MTRQITGFLLSSGIAAVANLGSRVIFSLVMPFSAAVSLAFCVGLSLAFLLNRRFVFTQAQNSMQSQFGRFLLVNLMALAQTFAVSLLARHLLLKSSISAGYGEALAHSVGIITPIFTSYMAHSRWTFRQNGISP